MVTVPVARLIVAPPVAPERTTEKISLPSESLSPMVVTVNVALV
jgi:hypothetical protein